MDFQSPPRLQDTFTDYARKISGYFHLRKHYQELKNTAPRGHGDPVLVIPGIINDDWFTKPLRNFLNEQGFKAYEWAGGVNRGPNAETVRHLQQRLDEIYRENGGRKIALVGHSLGGIYARELAHAYPEKISKVVTIASPFGMDARRKPVAWMMRVSFNILSRVLGSVPLDENIHLRTLMPPPVPTTSIFSRRDGLVGWRACLNPHRDKVENIEVPASHAGMLVSWENFLVVADRLAQDTEAWRPYDASRYASNSRMPHLYTGDVPALPPAEILAKARPIFPKIS